MKDQETMAQQALEEEARRHHEAYSKLERERSTEIELLHTRWALPGSPVLWGSSVFPQSLLPCHTPPRSWDRHCSPHFIDGKLSQRESFVSLQFYL